MTDLKKPARRVLTIVKPPKRISEMTDAERERFAAQIVGAATRDEDGAKPS